MTYLVFGVYACSFPFSGTLQLPLMLVIVYLTLSSRQRRVPRYNHGLPEILGNGLRGHTITRLAMSNVNF